MEIRVNPFSLESIDNALALLSTFTESTLDKVDELIALMVEEGEYVALAKCLPAESGETSDSIMSESKVTGLRHNRYGYIIAGGAAVYLEFGTGVFYNGAESYPGERPAGVSKIGEYVQKGKPPSKGKNDWWYYYDDKQGRIRATHGIAARAFMWQTATHLRNHFPELARKVWKG